MSGTPTWTRKVTNALLPPSEHDDPAFRAEMLRQIASGMRFFGIIALIVPLPPLIAIAFGLLDIEVLHFDETISAIRNLDLAVIFGGALGLWLARKPERVKWGRPVNGAMLVIAAALFVPLELSAGLTKGPFMLPLLIVLGTSLIPYRPAQAMTIAVLAFVSYELAELYFPVAVPIEHSLRVARAITVLAPAFLFTLSITGISAALYQERMKAAYAQIERDKYARELEGAYRTLRETQAALAQSEKMASLGNLVAGIAHEINSPLGALQSNADVSQRAWTILEEAMKDPEVAAVFEKQRRLSRALETIKLTQNIVPEATTRIVRIVRELRTFARLDQAEVEDADLRDCLESTLTLINHELKNRIEVVRELGEIPKIRCHPNQLNQVFMNLLTNAAHAIHGPGKITVRTRADGSDFVVVEIQDSGAGIAPENLKRIFDPGFTTKGVGVGTGLGLSISYRIIDEHQGTIDVKSELGKGTTFTVRLPVQGTHSSDDNKPAHEHGEHGDHDDHKSSDTARNTSS
jgi:signal transduction histidine kinase